MRTYNMQPAGVTDVGNVRTSNEDHLLTEGDLFVVADGMGGEVGDIASRLAVQVLRDAFGADPTASGLLRAVQEANDAVHQRAIDDDRNGQLGTTVAAVGLVDQRGEARLSVVNVGDSRVYLLRNGELKRISFDHSVVADLVRSGQLTEADAVHHPERHRLTQALGVGQQVEPFQTMVDPEQGDRLLLCSDGLFNEVPDIEMADILTSAPEPDASVEQLVSRAKELGGSDNITAVVVDIT